MNIEIFKSKIKKRIIINIIILVFILMIYGLLLIFRVSLIEMTGIKLDEHWDSFNQGFCFGIVCAIIGVVLGTVIKYMNAIKKEEKLRKLYIKETDERIKIIEEKIGSVGFNICIFGMLITAVISSFINTTIFLTLLGCAFFFVIIKLILKIYYVKKY